MAHCVDFFKKWEKEENFCGLGKNSQKKINRYLEAVANEFLSDGVTEDDCYKYLPTSVLFGCGYLGLVEGPFKNEVRFKIIDKIKNRMVITKKDMVLWINLNSMTPEEIQKRYTFLAQRGIMAARARKETSIEAAKNPEKVKNMSTGSGISNDQSIDGRLALLYRLTTAGQKNILKKLSKMVLQKMNMRRYVLLLHGHLIKTKKQCL